MKKLATLAFTAFVASAIFQTAFAEDPVSPVPGAVCNLYKLPYWGGLERFIEISSTLANQPAVATFVDSASDFLPYKKKDNVESNIGMWTGWLKQEKAGTYTFLCQQLNNGSSNIYLIWINGKKCVEGGVGQTSFNVDLDAGFNSVKIIAGNAGHSGKNPLSITYKKAGSLKEPVSFGPENMFYEDEE